MWSPSSPSWPATAPALPARPASLILLAVLALLALLCGCGADTSAGLGEATTSSHAHPTSATSPAEAALPPGCRAGDPALRQADHLTSADLQGDGTAARVAATAAGSGPCASLLLVRVATGGQARLAGARLEGLAPSSVHVISLGAVGRYLAVRTDHPRGGSQQHLLGLADGRLREVSAVTTAPGTPLAPFVAADVRESLAMLDCVRPAHGAAGAAGRLLRLTVAHPTRPPGVALTWSVTATTYDVHGVRAEPRTQHHRETYPDRALERDHPALAHGAMLQSCRPA